MKRILEDDWTDDEDFDIEEKASMKSYLEQQRLLRNIHEIDSDALEEDRLEEESAEEFWFTRGVEKATDDAWEGEE